MGKLVLVIDDEQGVRDAFRLALEGLPYTVVTVASGEEGLAIVRDACPSLIFLDLRMPGIDGVETRRRLQRLCPDSRVYVITAFYQAYLEPLRELRADGIPFQLAQKPLAANDIREITRSVLEGPEASRHA